MNNIIDWLLEEAVSIQYMTNKYLRDGTWPVQSKHPGLVNFDMEQTGTSSRFNTLRALRVLLAYI